MGRAANFERPLVPALYDLDVRLTSRLVWGTSVATQARFAADVTAGVGGPVAITTWTDQGRWLARRAQRLLARLDAVARPRSVADYTRLFEEAGLTPRSSTLGGTVLRWRGERSAD